MRVFSTITLAGLLAAGAGVLAITPAAANRCGLGYPVDHPTTLVEVAQRCNVNLSFMRPIPALIRAMSVRASISRCPMSGAPMRVTYKLHPKQRPVALRQATNGPPAHTPLSQIMVVR